MISIYVADNFMQLNIFVFFMMCSNKSRFYKHDETVYIDNI